MMTKSHFLEISKIFIFCFYFMSQSTRNRSRNKEDEAWRIIFGGPRTAQKSYMPNAGYLKQMNMGRNANIVNNRPNARYTSPYATMPLFEDNKGGNKKYTTAVIQSNRPLTTSEHNRLINNLKKVTAV